MKKYLYLVVGIGVLIWAGCASFWFYSEIPYLFNGQLAQIRIIGTIVSWLFGIACLYYGVRHEKINFLSNISVILFGITLLSSLVLMFFGCTRIGAPCLANEILASYLSRGIFGWGVVLSIVSMLVSFLIRKNHVRP